MRIWGIKLLRSIFKDDYSKNNNKNQVFIKNNNFDKFEKQIKEKKDIKY